MTQHDARICPRPGHLVRVRFSQWGGVSDFPPPRNTGLVVASRGVEVQIMINNSLAWIRRDRLEVLHGDSTKSS